MLHVCPLSQLETVASAHPFSALISLMSPSMVFQVPGSAARLPHLTLRFNDIPEEREGYVAPAPQHVVELLRFAQTHITKGPVLVHCWAGISRSTAAAYLIACARNEPGQEANLADRLRTLAPSATPNPLLVKYADQLLERDGRMIDAIARIGRGADAYEGTPFCYPVQLAP
ncbi:protein-tyrosine phosphatase family protein [Pseudovibrio exalbescens]|uniref:tyrosine phosphatase family protein n=1 Tax=Pseudovibrio exalbescens TaxID=197461 RepID=UPI002366361B|nr:protein-tyrosine phosphatase family protein [Pseudovibrio exalbescens]MDD7911219.1 protein-tyrosine phosphatase family protein [Pseudovibrio exalbescens]